MSNFASFQVARVASMISELFLFSLYDLPFPSEIHQNKNLPLRQIHLFEVPVFQDFLVNSVCDFYICTDRELILPSRCLDLSLEVSRLSGLQFLFGGSLAGFVRAQAVWPSHNADWICSVIIIARPFGYVCSSFHFRDIAKNYVFLHILFRVFPKFLNAWGGLFGSSSQFQDLDFWWQCSRRNWGF